MLVSFDYDGTLSRSDVRSFASELADKGFKIVVVTSRTVGRENDDLRGDVRLMGLGGVDVYYTDGGLKVGVLSWLRPVLHFDDSSVELSALVGGRTVGINVGDDGWDVQAKEILGIR